MYRVTVVAPGVGLRTRFDTYGVQVNDASIVLMVEYPAQRVYVEPDPANTGRVDRGMTRPRSWRLLLGADAQFTSWAQSAVDFVFACFPRDLHPAIDGAKASWLTPA